MVSRKIIEIHGGEIAFHSEVNKGTSVYIMLPIAQAEAGENVG